MDLLVADSWLVLDGSVRSLDRHVRRFTRSCLEVGGVTPLELDRFWRETIAALPRTGAWFPRVELAGDPPSLRLRIRPAPPRGEHVRVWVPDEPDHRRSPARKGPDLEALGNLRAEAERHDAQEALLRTADGIVVEAASSSVLWWEDDVLCAPPEEIPALPGTTAGLVLDLATARGIPTARRARRVDELAGREVWLLNALHGIRLVTGLAGAGVNPGSGIRPVTALSEYGVTPGSGIRPVTALSECGVTLGGGRHFTAWRERVERLRTPLDPLAKSAGFR